jgi:hypothetical protein
MSTPDDAWHAAWGMIHARAWSKLRHSYDLEPRRGYPWLQLWSTATGFDTRDVPSEPELFSVLRPSSCEPVVRRALWRRTHDLQRLRLTVERNGRPATFEPAVDIEEASLETNVFEGAIAELRQMSIPLAWFVDDPSVTCDASAVGFAYADPDHDPPAVLRLEWSHGMPRAWEPLRDWWHKVDELLSAKFAPNGGKW